MKMYVVRNEFTFAKEVNLAKITPPILFLKNTRDFTREIINERNENK